MTVPLGTQQDIREMDARGVPRAAISRELGVNRKTVAKYSDEEDVARELDALPTLDDWPDLDDVEREHRAMTLEAIRKRILEDGPRVAMPSPERGRQFMPFAALKGYKEMLQNAEKRAQEWTGYDAPDAPEKPAFGHGAGPAIKDNPPYNVW